MWGASDVDDQVYEGVVAGLSKDGTKYIIKCKEIADWYGVEARLPAAEKPAGVEVGDFLRFSVTLVGGGAPVISWSERDTAKCLEAAKRKAEKRLLPKAGEELYEGKVRQQSAKDPQSYLVECPCVTDWFKKEARAPADVLFLAGATVGDEIVFSLKPDEPVLAWAELKSESEASARKRPKGDAAATPGAGAAAGGDELGRLRAELQAERVAKLEAQLEAERARVVALGGAAPGLPKVQDWTDELLEGTPARAKDPAAAAAKSKLAPEPVVPTTSARLRFASADDALAALALYGTELEGREVQPEAVDGDTCAVLVRNLVQGLTASKLRNHFQEAGKILDVSIGGSGGKAGQGKAGKGKDGKGKDGKGKLAKGPMQDGKGKGKGGKGPKGAKGAKGPAAAAVVGEVFFATTEAAEEALALFGTVLLGSKLRISLRAGSADGKAVTVEGLPPEVTSKDLREHFQECGEIRAAKLAKA